MTEVRSELTRLTAALKLLDKYAPVKSRLLSSRPEVTEADFLDDGAYRQELDAVAQICARGRHSTCRWIWAKP